MQNLQEAVQNDATFEDSSADAHWRTTLQMQLLHQDFHAVLALEYAFQSPHGREAAPVQNLQEAVQNDATSEASYAGAYG